MRFSFIIVLTVILSGTFAIPIPGPKVKPKVSTPFRVRAGDIIKVKPKDLTPIHDMGGNAKGLDNNHPAIVVKENADNTLKVSHLSSNPPVPNIHVHSVVNSQPVRGKMYIGDGGSTVARENVRAHVQFPNGRVTAEELAKIQLATNMHRAASDAASKRRNTMEQAQPGSSSSGS